jgi:DNA-binding MarR family transcriptional regulator
MGKLKNYGFSEGVGKYDEEAIYSLALIYNIIAGQVSSYLRQYNLTIGKFNILMAVKHQGGSEGISQVDVSNHLIVTPSNMSKLIDKLEREDFVVRSPLAGDRRVHILKITSKGSDLLDEVWGGYLQTIQDLYGKLNERKQKELASLLTEWFGILNQG